MGVGVADVAVTFLLAVYSAWEFGGNLFIHFMFWVVVGELLHYAFGVQTAGMDMLGITACSRTS
jgi:hypothetical protein